MLSFDWVKPSITVAWSAPPAISGTTTWHINADEASAPDTTDGLRATLSNREIVHPRNAQALVRQSLKRLEALKG